MNVAEVKVGQRVLFQPHDRVVTGVVTHVISRNPREPLIRILWSGYKWWCNLSDLKGLPSNEGEA